MSLLSVNVAFVALLLYYCNSCNFTQTQYSCYIAYIIAKSRQKELCLLKGETVSTPQDMDGMDALIGVYKY